MALAVVQRVDPASDTTGTSHTFSVPATTLNNLLVAVIATKVGTTDNVSGVTDSATQTWTAGPANAVAGSNTRINIYYMPSSASITTFTVSTTSSHYCSAMLYEISGYDTATPLDGSNSVANSTASTSQLTGAVTNTNANAIYIAGVSWGSSVAASAASSGYTLGANPLTASASVQGIADAYQIVTSAASRECTFTTGSTKSGGAQLVIAAASGAAAVNFSPSVVGAGSVSADVISTPRFTPAVVGAGVVAATVKSTPLFTPAVVGAGSVAVTLASTPLLAPAVAGAGSIAVTLTSPALLTPAVVAAGVTNVTLSTPPPPGSPALIQYVAPIGQGFADPHVYTCPATTAGSCLVAVVTVRSTALGSVTGITDAAGNTWVVAVELVKTSALTYVCLCYALNAASITSFSVATPGGQGACGSLYEFSNIATASALDTTGSDPGTGTTTPNTTGGAFTTANANDVLVVGIGHASTATESSASSGFTAGGSIARVGTTQPGLADAYAIVSATGTYTCTIGMSGTITSYAGVSLALQAAPVSTPVNFSPSVVGAGSVSASVISTPLLTPSVVGAGAVAVTLTSPALLTPAVVAAGVVSAAVKSTPLLAPAIVGAGAITANVSSVPFLTPSIVGTGIVTAAVASTPRFVPAVAGTGTVSVSLTSPALLAPSVVAASTVTVAFTVHSAITRDTWVSNANPTFNYGAATSVASAGVGSATPANIILRLDLTPYQAGGTIGAGGASLTLYVASSTAAARDWDAYPLQAANAGWTEGTGSGSATGDGATWNTKDGTNAWAGGANGAGVAGTDYDNTVALFTTALHYAISDPADTALTATFSAAGITALQAALGSTLDIILIRQGASTVTGPGLRSHETASPNKPLFFIDYVAPALIPSIVVVSTVAATVSSTPLLSPAIAAAGVVSASVASTPRFTPAIVAAGAVTATVSSTPLLTPVVAGAGVVAVALTSPALLAASVAGAGAIAASLTSPALLSPAVAGAGVVSATVASTPFLSPAVAGAGVVAAMVKSTPLLSPVVTGAGVIAIALTSPALLSPAVVGAGSVAADIQTPGVPFLTPSVVGAGSVAVTLTTPARLSVAVVGAGTVSTTLASPALLSAAVGGAGVVVAALTSPALMTPTVAGAGSAAATLITPHLFVVAAVGTTTVTATLLSTPLLSPTVAGGATITTTITSAALLSPAVSGASMVAVTLSSPALMTVTISGVTTVTAAITVLLPGAPHIIHISGTDDTVTLVAGSDTSAIALVGSLDAIQLVGSVSGPLSIVGSYDLILVIGDPDVATKTDGIVIDIGADSAIEMTITGTGSIAGQTFRAGIANRGNPNFDVLDGVPVITDAAGRVVTWALTDTQTLALVAGSQYTYAIWRADDASEAPLAYGQCTLRRLPGAS